MDTLAPPKRTLIQEVQDRWADLKRERASWIPHWREISEHLLPRAGRFIAEDRNRGDRRDHEIIDNTGTMALATNAAGMISYGTSPAKPWLRLVAPDPDLGKQHAVKVWLDEVTRRVLGVLADSNAYRVLHQMYEELAAFGTAACIIMPDEDEVVHLRALTIGEYCLAADSRGRVDTLYREFQMTVAQMVEKFGFERCSRTVQDLASRKQWDTWRTVIHAIEPRRKRNPRKLDKRNMRWRSVYFEPGTQGSDAARDVLRESGFDRFPVLAPRWSVTGGDVYGRGPGMDVLGDLKQLQHEQMAKAKGIDYGIEPPLQGPSEGKNAEADYLPGGYTVTNPAGPRKAIDTAFESRLDLREIREDIGQCQYRIERGFHADLFRMLAHANDTQKTAEEIIERREEKLLMVGPVINRQQNEIHEPLIDQVFERMQDEGMLPPAPPELEEMDLGIEYVSVLAQAQSAVGASTIDRFMVAFAGVSELDPRVRHKLDGLEWVDDYAHRMNVPPKMVRPTEEVLEIIEKEAAAQQAAAQTEMMQVQAGTARDLAAAVKDAPSDPVSPFAGPGVPT